MHQKCIDVQWTRLRWMQQQGPPLMPIDQVQWNYSSPFQESRQTKKFLRGHLQDLEQLYRIALEQSERTHQEILLGRFVGEISEGLWWGLQEIKYLIPEREGSQGVLRQTHQEQRAGQPACQHIAGKLQEFDEKNGWIFGRPQDQSLRLFCEGQEHWKRLGTNRLRHPQETPSN